MNQKIAIASDHGGFILKEFIKSKFPDIDWLDLGANNDESVDYPKFGQAVGRAVTEDRAGRGVVICGSGIGISIAVNRFPAVRGALCTSREMARLSRQHNDANVLALGARITDEATALECVESFLNTEFEGGRHARRVDQLS